MSNFKKISVIVMVMFITSLTIFISCNSEEESFANVLKKIDDTSGYIAHYDSKEQKIIMDFDIDVFRSEVESCIEKEMDRNIVVEK
ncbi:MAG: hypothetical protein Q4Q06_01965, partial [Bacteroidota bacterium]|nr:hypothetical protein [Bacteroidota bacterium]